MYPISTEELWSSVRVTIEFLVTSLPKALLPRLFSFQLSETHTSFKNDGATVFLGTTNAAEMFWYLFPDLCLDTILVRSSTGNSSSCLGFCSDMHCQLWDLIWTGVCLSKSCPINWIYHRWTPINGNRMYPSSISSLIAKGLNTYVNKVFLQKCLNLFSLCHYGVLCVDCWGFFILI